MFKGTLHQRIPYLFGLQSSFLSTQAMSKVLDGNHNVVDEFRIHSYWIAQISGYEFFSPIIRTTWHKGIYEALTITVLHTDKGLKGLLLIPPIREPLDRILGGPQPLKPLELGDWKDPVAAALQAINLFPEANWEKHGTTFYRYVVKVVAGNATDVEISEVGPAGLEAGQLLTPLLETTYHLVDLYDDDEMREYVKREPQA